MGGLEKMVKLMSRGGDPSSNKDRVWSRGFTFIELIVVIAIIAILTTLATHLFLGYTNKAKIARLKNDAKQISNASERYYMDHGEYPFFIDSFYERVEVEDVSAEDIIHKVEDFDDNLLNTKDGVGLFEIDFEALKPYLKLNIGAVYYVAAVGNPEFGICALDPFSDFIEQRFKTIRVNINPGFIQSGNGPKEFTAIVTDLEGNPVKNTNITFSVDGVGVTVGGNTSGKTDEQGIASFTLDVVDMETGALIVHVLIGEDIQKQVSITVLGDMFGDIIQISVGESHTLALTSGGEVYAWGRNNYGQLGVEDLNYSYVPTKIEGLSNIKSIAAGYDHSLALSDTGDTVYAWGRNDYGQLGDDTFGDAKSTPVQAQSTW